MRPCDLHILKEVSMQKPDSTFQGATTELDLGARTRISQEQQNFAEAVGHALAENWLCCHVEPMAKLPSSGPDSDKL